MYNMRMPRESTMNWEKGDETDEVSYRYSELYEHFLYLHSVLVICIYHLLTFSF